MSNSERLPFNPVNEFPTSQSQGVPSGIPPLQDPLGFIPETPPPVSTTPVHLSEKGHEDNPLKAKIAQFGVVAETDVKIKKLQDELSASQESLEQWSRAEAVWNTQRRLFKVMTENVSDLIVLLDVQGNRMWNNPAYSHTLGYLAEDLAGTYGLSEVHPEDRVKAIGAFDEAVARKTTQQAEYRMKHKDGRWLVLQTEIVPILTEGRVESLVLLAHDVTQMRKMEDEVAQASKEIKTAGMIEGMAHDFDQILTTVFGNLAIARNLNGPNHAVATRLNEIERALTKAREMIEKLATVSHAGETTKELLPIEPLVQETVSNILRGTMVRAEFNFPRHLPQLEIDREALTHVVSVIVTNSSQAMDKGVIRVTAELVTREQLAQHPDIPLKSGNYVCLVIRDQGHGMTERTLMSAFQPYFTTRAGSQGLGLSTALASMQRMGGTLLLDSTEFVGTTAYVYIPAPTDARMRTGNTGALPTAAQAEPAKKKRVLLMDDEQMILDIVSRMLTHIGYEVTVCTDGAQAIAAFAKSKMQGTPFDVVLMDLVIPTGVGGQDAVHTIRKIDPNAKVIASSGHLEHPAMTDHKKFGFAAILEKPYKLERLQQVLESVLNA